jgi:hypothetical protein
MSMKEQVKKLKENWLIVALFIVLLILVYGSNTFISSGGIGGFMTSKYAAMESAISSDAMYRGGGYYPMPSADFAPEVQERIITKDASLSNEVNRGAFQESEAKLKSILVSSDAYLLNENVNKYGEGWKAYYTGSYQIKIETQKYNAVLEQLKGIGKVTSFWENAQDITGTYTDLKTTLAAEQERLARYRAMYSEAKDVNEKLTLSDRIFEQERTVKYLEDAIKGMDNQVDYSQIYFTMSEKQSGYIGIAFVTLSALVAAFVNSINFLLNVIVYLLPWVIIYLIIRWIYRKASK